MENIVSNLKLECATQKDVLSCMKYRILNLFEATLNKDSVKVSESVQLVKNDEEKPMGDSQTQGRGFVDEVESYITGHDLKVQLPGPLAGATLTVSPRNMDNDELKLSLQFPKEEETSVGSERGKKHKIRKILVPIMIFILLKAMTLVPLAIGVLGLKAWNALQLSFFSFIISIALAIFQLCKKIASDSAPPAVHAAGPWEYSAAHYAAARNFLLGPQDVESAASELVSNVESAPVVPSEQSAQNLAYSAYSEQARR
uniref:Osiris 19 n=1 Tax=Cacopsylla melanoneura TaxID=428564 RepID=A0A8D9ANU6_9HEMI